VTIEALEAVFYPEPENVDSVTVASTLVPAIGISCLFLCPQGPDADLQVLAKRSHCGAGPEYRISHQEP
jgi:hypothetical protein